MAAEVPRQIRASGWPGAWLPRAGQVRAGLGPPAPPRSRRCNASDVALHLGENLARLGALLDPRPARASPPA
jgi:hypothetical protein